MEFLPECEIKEECGVFGIFNPDGGDVAPSIYYGLSSLQHRGQESCGIAVCDTMGPKGNMNAHKGMGLVNEVPYGIWKVISESDMYVLLRQVHL